MKKLLNILLVMVMLLTVVPVKADTVTGKITITNAVSGETYKIYKMASVLNYDGDNVSYTVEAPWLEFFTQYSNEETEENDQKYFELIATDDDDIFYVKLIKEPEDIAEFAKAALAYAGTTITPTDSKDASGEEVVFDDLDLGYYLVDSSLGVLCSLDTVKPEVEIEEKNETTTIIKEVKDESGEWSSSNTASIGDTVEYQITVANPANLHNVKVTDTIDSSLTLTSDSVKVTRDGTDITEDDGVTVKYTDTGFEVSFLDSFLEGNTADIVITCSAVLNETAIIAGDGNKNEVTLSYGENQNQSDDVVTKTYQFALEKQDDEEKTLEGAKFNLLDADENVIKVVEVDGGYRVAVCDATGCEEGATDVIVAGTVTISGLGNGEYSLKEIEAPEGYNKLAGTTDFTIADANLEESVVVVNTTSMVLPSTGGMGTVLFITIGSIMVLGFGVILLTKFRMSKVNA